MTTFPPPPAGHAWHNPDNLTPEQVGEGYRLLLESEVHPRRDDFVKEIQGWMPAIQRWNNGGLFGANTNYTYRVPLATWPLPAPVEPQPDARQVAIDLVHGLLCELATNATEMRRADIAHNLASMRDLLERFTTRKP